MCVGCETLPAVATWLGFIFFLRPVPMFLFSTEDYVNGFFYLFLFLLHLLQPVGS